MRCLGAGTEGSRSRRPAVRMSLLLLADAPRLLSLSSFSSFSVSSCGLRPKAGSSFTEKKQGKNRPRSLTLHTGEELIYDGEEEKKKKVFP